MAHHRHRPSSGVDRRSVDGRHIAGGHPGEEVGGHPGEEVGGHPGEEGERRNHGDRRIDPGGCCGRGAWE